MTDRKNNRRIALFLVLLTVAGLSASACSTDTEQSRDPEQTKDSAGTIAAEDDNAYEDNLGDYDFGDDAFHMLTRTYVLIHSNLDTEETSGDPINDAIYERNRALEERFNFSFKETYYNFAENTNDYPRQFLLAGDNEFDLYTGRMINMFTFAAENLFLPVDDLPHIDPTKPWWNAALYDTMQIAGSHRFIVGEFNLSSADFTHVMLFNKKLVNDFGIENLYDLVRDGKWTFDAFAKYSKLPISDLNGDQTMDETDRWGYTAASHHVLPSFWIGADAEFVVRDNNGLLDFVATENEHILDVLGRIYEMTWDNDVWHPNFNDDGTLETNIFINGGALFTDASCFQLTTTLRNSEVEFGVLPFPKWDESQKNYRSRIEGCELFGVGIGYPDTEMIGVILEAMACASYSDLRPAYYDSALRIKGTRDEESVEMLDLIFANRIFDYGDTLLVNELTANAFKFAFRANNRNMASLLESAEKQCDAVLAMYNDGFSDQPY